jgi:hypothetical protein
VARILWIVGLGIAVFVWGGLALGSLVYAVWHRHITMFGGLNILESGGIAYACLLYMRLKLRQRRKNALSDSDEPGDAINLRFP